MSQINFRIKKKDLEIYKEIAESEGLTVAELARKAAEAGAVYTLRTNCYNISRDGNYWNVYLEKLGQKLIIRAKIVIAADGVESRVGGWAGLTTSIAIHDMEA